MDPSALALLEHENWIAYLAASISLHEGGLVVRDRGIVSLLGHVPMRFFNQILVESPDAAVSAIEGGVRLGRERGDPFVVSLRDGVDDRFKPLMPGLGLLASDDAATQAMTMHPVSDRARSTEPEPGFEIERVADASALEEFRGSVTAGFGADPSVARAMMGVGLLDRREGSVYLGYLKGQPVTAGLGWRTGRTIGVYNIATIPTARRRGFGEAMTARVIADGAAAGCDVAALQASWMGRPIYARLGFQASVQYTGYVDSSASKG
jgi:ribosomal protein S18 acetylase RimI-like enzyme